ncbi:MAG TPA: siderophore-interacting protein [Thermomicrobiaceae bacterium]|nr:siderophore-interacting protein [Thermomicrobiaceae bacterium]
MTTTGIQVQTIPHQFAFRLLQVRRTARLAPHMVRVTLCGEQLEGFRSDGADDGCRLYFPPDPTDASWAPIVEGTTLTFPDDRVRQTSREFTPRRHDPARGELDVDFVVHGEGAASTWAANAAPGHYLGVAGPRRSRVVSGDVAWYLLAGDETGIPSIGRRLEELPAGMPVVAVIEVADPTERQALDTRAALDLTWVYRDGAGGDTSGLLADAIRRLEFPRGAVFAWAAGEASSIRAVRRHLLGERGIPSEQMRMTGYWKRAVANYDHHLPLDE